jgi:hypothetical protein
MQIGSMTDGAGADRTTSGRMYFGFWDIYVLAGPGAV